MLRFSFKMPFTYAKEAQLTALYQSPLASLVQQLPSLSILTKQHKQLYLTPGNFHAVRIQYRLASPGCVTHDALLEALLQEQSLKLEQDIKRMGFIS